MGTNITGIGNANAIGFKSRVTGGIYFPPELKDALVGVWSAYGKSNDSTDRNIIKNKIKDRGGDFVISNAAFKLNSGFGGFVEDFTSWDRIDSSTAEISNDGSKIKCINTTLNVQYLFNYINRDISSFKVKISNFTKGDITYYYRKEDGIEAFFKITPLSVVNSDKVIELPKSYNTVENGTGSRGGFYSSNINIGVTIEQIPSFEGAFVTDGIDDLITSTKTVQEMGVTDEITIVSMIHQIQLNPSSSITNDIRVSSNNTSGSNGRIVVSAKNKTGIYGWSRKGNTKVIITKILGDKNDYSLAGENSTNYNNKFSVVGTVDNRYNSSVAWYWTIIANKVLTTDEINQVIAYFNLDRCVEPTVLYDVKRQGLSNYTPDSDWYLKDFSKNGFDMSLFNFAKKGGSGVAAKQGESIKDYSIIKDEEYQELTIYNEFKFKIKSKLSGRYWTVQYINRTNTSYPVTIVIDKDAYWVNSTTYYDADNNKQVIRKNIPIAADTPTNVLCCGYDQFDIPEDAMSIVSAVSYIDYNAAGEITVEFIPSCKGGLITDGVNDYGKVTGLPIYKDYTFIIDREIISIGNTAGIVASKSEDSTDVNKQGAFLFEYLDAPNNISAWSFYKNNGKVANTDFTRGISYQSKYSYNGIELLAGTALDSDKLWLGILRDKDSRFANVAIYSLMSFPYSMSEFLIERQLKKHKLGTLYPDMVEFRPIVKSNFEYQVVDCYIDTFPAVVGNYYPINSKLRIAVTTKGEADEVISLTVNGVSLGTPSVNGNKFTFNGTLSDKSPQKINITIDEYIRYEDIVQPYPVIFQITDRNTNQRYSWGDKIKVGSSIQLSQGEKPNLLSGLYSIQSYEYEGKTYSYNQLTNLNIILTKQSISLSCNKIWLLDDNEPKCILSPRLLRIPNSSYKILGYIPDISGHGNHGVIHNSAYAEGSGVNEDGSYQFDGVDDFVTIPTTVGGKQVLMKVNWQSYAGGVTLYDQRLNLPDYEFAIYNGDRDLDDNPIPAYQGRNNGQTYIDGILNNNIKASELRHITHNITITNELSLGTNNTYPVIGSTRSNTHFAQMSLYDFMLFDNISTDDKIKELNEYVGIEAKVELPPYYWDAYGKTNLDADKATIQQRGVAVGDYDLTNYNHAYNKMSGYGGYKFAKFDNTIEWFAEDSSMVVNRNGYLITLKKVPNVAFWRFRNTTLKSLDNPLTFKVKCNKPIDVIFQVKFAKNNDVSIGYNYNIKEVTLVPNESTTIIVPSVSVSDIPEATSILFINVLFDNTSLSDNEEYTVEMLPLYPNGLLYDAITDYSENVNIPVFTDFTAIMKRKWLKNQGCPLIKGSKVYEGGNGNALLFEWDKAYNFVFYKRTDIMEREVPENISFITPTNYNGNVITRGSGQDTNGICIAGDGNAGFANIVFYKLILYPKTIPLLQINFLKNLMERDEIIDLNNPIFIKNE